MAEAASDQGRKLEIIDVAAWNAQALHLPTRGCSGNEEGEDSPCLPEQTGGGRNQRETLSP